VLLVSVELANLELLLLSNHEQHAGNGLADHAALDIKKEHSCEYTPEWVGMWVLRISFITDCSGLKRSNMKSSLQNN
jgi:hypothetical protein